MAWITSQEGLLCFRLAFFGSHKGTKKYKEYIGGRPLRET